MLRMLLPTMLPMVMSALPFRAAEMLTAASGALVPMATMVRPITSCGMRNFRRCRLHRPQTSRRP